MPCLYFNDQSRTRDWKDKLAGLTWRCPYDLIPLASIVSGVLFALNTRNGDLLFSTHDTFLLFA
jgi:hypothetical protein